MTGHPADRAFGETTRALKIHPKWLAQILARSKKIEIRGRRCKVRETVSLMETGTGLIKGRARIADCRALTEEEHLEFASTLASLHYKTPWAWVLEQVVTLDIPIVVPSEVRRNSITWASKSRWRSQPAQQ
jgi:hypothetical protein